MKLSTLLFAAALAGTATLLVAGPDSRTFMLPKTPAPAAATTVTATPMPAAPVATCATCACCKKAS